jgi:hypothetical protein
MPSRAPAVARRYFFDFTWAASHSMIVTGRPATLTGCPSNLICR